MKINPNKIPMMIDPLGKSWSQPDNSNYIINDTTVFMPKKDVEKLRNYSQSRPSGVYAGKMWKRQLSNGKWLLCWFGYCQEPNLCSINERYIEEI